MGAMTTGFTDRLGPSDTTMWRIERDPARFLLGGGRVPEYSR